MQKKILWSAFSFCTIFNIVAKNEAYEAHFKKYENLKWESREIIESENPVWTLLKDFKPKTEKKFAVIITAFNVKDWYKINLDSVFGQEYKNYRVIYIDDKSTDDTPNLVEKYIKDCGQEKKVTLIKNQVWKSQMANHYTAAHLCDDDEIMINLDCDDWFAHKDVLTLYNKIFTAYPDVWVTYGGTEYWPKEFGFANRPVPERHTIYNTFREGQYDDKFTWAWWHPRVFYAWVFKQVKLQDLIHQSSFKPMAPSPDSAFMYPILELSGFHTKYIPDVTYIWNMRNPLSQWCSSGTKQLEINRLSASWEKYEKLKQSQEGCQNKFMYSNADLIIFSNKNARKLSRYLKSVISNVKNIKKIHVLYESDDDSAPLYNLMKKTFEDINFINCNDRQAEIKNIITKLLKNDVKDHVILAADSVEIQDEFNTSDCIKDLERTYAHGYFLTIHHTDLNNNIETHAPLSDNLSAWQFKFGKKKGRKAYSLNSVLYRKADILSALGNLEYNDLDSFKRSWYSLNNNEQLVGRKVGLFKLPN